MLYTDPGENYEFHLVSWLTPRDVHWDLTVLLESPCYDLFCVINLSHVPDAI